MVLPPLSIRLTETPISGVVQPAHQLVGVPARRSALLCRLPDETFGCGPRHFGRIMFRHAGVARSRSLFVTTPLSVGVGKKLIEYLRQELVHHLLHLLGRHPEYTHLLFNLDISCENLTLLLHTQMKGQIYRSLRVRLK